MIQYLLFIVILINIFYKNKTVEGMNRTCCGDMSSDLIDFNCASKKVPEGVKRCYKATDEYDCDDCGDICNGEGECIPTLKGGYCKIDSTTSKIYDGNDFVELKKEKIGGKINDSTRAREKYKKLYSQECNPFATKSGEGDYNSHDEFDDIDKLEDKDDKDDYGITSYIVGTIIIVAIAAIAGLVYYKRVRV